MLKLNIFHIKNQSILFALSINEFWQDRYQKIIYYKNMELFPRIVFLWELLLMRLSAMMMFVLFDYFCTWKKMKKSIIAGVGILSQNSFFLFHRVCTFTRLMLITSFLYFIFTFALLNAYSLIWTWIMQIVMVISNI